MRHLPCAAALMIWLVLWSASGPVVAQDCSDAIDQTSMNQCAAQAYRTADRHLNAAYRALQDRLEGDPDAGQKLILAQRAWIAFRDAECLFQAIQVQGGSLYPTVHANCLTALTENRTEELESSFQPDR